MQERVVDMQMEEPPEKTMKSVSALNNANDQSRTREKWIRQPFISKSL